MVDLRKRGTPSYTPVHTAAALESGLMSPIDDVLVQQLLLFVVMHGRRHLVFPQSGILTDFFQRVILQKASILKHGHQEILEGHRKQETLRSAALKSLR